MYKEISPDQVRGFDFRKEDALTFWYPASGVDPLIPEGTPVIRAGEVDRVLPNGTITLKLSTEEGYKSFTRDKIVRCAMETGKGVKISRETE